MSSPTKAYLECRNGNVRRLECAVRNRAVSRVVALSAFLSAGGQEPIQVTVAELHRHPSRFHEREVVVRGELDSGRTSLHEMYVLRDKAHSVMLVAPSAPSSDLTLLDAETRTVTLTPVEPLPLLKQVSLSLYRGIAGADGQPLRVAPQTPRSIQSRRGALQQGADLRELVVLTFVTRGY